MVRVGVKRFHLETEIFQFLFFRDYLQKERAKYKDLLANAQNDLNVTKSIMERENDLKQTREHSLQQMMDEKARLTSSYVKINQS